MTNTPTPNQGAYPTPDTHPWNVFPVGMDACGGDVTLDVQAHPHVFISGAGSGERAARRALLAHALLNGEWRVAVIDPTGTESSQYLNHSSVFLTATDPQQALEAMEELQQEMDARYDRMRDETVNYFRDLQQTPPPIMIAVADASAILDQGAVDAETRSRLGILIGSLARLGRAAGIHLMLSARQPGNDIGNDILPPETMSNLDARITEEQKSNEGSLMVLQAGDTHTQFLPYTASPPVNTFEFRVAADWVIAIESLKMGAFESATGAILNIESKVQDNPTSLVPYLELSAYALQALNPPEDELISRTEQEFGPFLRDTLALPCDPGIIRDVLRNPAGPVEFLPPELRLNGSLYVSFAMLASLARRDPDPRSVVGFAKKALELRGFSTWEEATKGSSTWEEAIN